LMPLRTSDRISVSSSDLFTRCQPPGPLLPDLHGVLNNLIEQIGIFPPGPEQRVGRRLGHRGRRRRLRLRNLPKEQACGFGHRVIDRCEPAAMYDRFNRAFGRVLRGLNAVSRSLITSSSS
jgi:hypothetical protein